MFSRGIVAAMEDEIIVNEGDEVCLIEERKQDEQVNEIVDDFHALGVSTQIENTLQTKVDRGEDLTDEEIVIATEAIGNLYLKTSSDTFRGFGFEQHAGKTLTQKEKTKIAMEAISNQNGEKAYQFKKKLENFNNSLSDGFSASNAGTKRLLNDAKDVLDKVKRTDDSFFGKSKINDKRVSIAVQRGYKTPPFKSYKEVLKALEGMISSLKVVSVASKYETLGSGKDSQYDLAQLAKDLDSKVIVKTTTSVTYDLNPDKLTGGILTLKIPADSDNGYLMRNLKANFVVYADYNIWRVVEKSQGLENKSLSKKECIELLEEVIKHIEDQEHLFKLYYNDARVDITDFLKQMGKSLIGSWVLGYNSIIFRSRIENVALKIHHLNRQVIRGLIAWAASSMD
jgi:hypothetical protein